MTAITKTIHPTRRRTFHVGTGSTRSVLGMRRKTATPAARPSGRRRDRRTFRDDRDGDRASGAITRSILFYSARVGPSLCVQPFSCSTPKLGRYQPRKISPRGESKTPQLKEHKQTNKASYHCQEDRLNGEFLRGLGRSVPGKSCLMMGEFRGIYSLALAIMGQGQGASEESMTEPPGIQLEVLS